MKGLNNIICHTYFILNSPDDWRSHLCLLIVFIQRKNKFLTCVKGGGFGARDQLKVGSSSPTETEIGVPSSLMITF